MWRMLFLKTFLGYILIIRAATTNDNCLCHYYECNGYAQGTSDYDECISSNPLWVDTTHCTHCMSCNYKSPNNFTSVCSCDKELNCNSPSSLPHDNWIWWAIIGAVIAVLLALFIAFTVYYLLKLIRDDRQLAMKRRKEIPSNAHSDQSNVDSNPKTENQSEKLKSVSESAPTTDTQTISNPHNQSVPSTTIDENASFPFISSSEPKHIQMDTIIELELIGIDALQSTDSATKDHVEEKRIEQPSHDRNLSQMYSHNKYESFAL